NLADTGYLERLVHQADQFYVTAGACMAKEFCPYAHRHPGGEQPPWTCMQYMVGIAQSYRPLVAFRLSPHAIGVNSCHLGGDVRPYTHHPAGELVDNLEGLQIQVV